MRKIKFSRATYYRSSLAGLFMSSFIAPGLAAQLEPLREPKVFASQNGILDLVMVANPKPALDIAGLNGWVYSICPRTFDAQQSCPDDDSTVSYYGGARLALQRGDLLKVRLVNRLPPIPDAAHVTSHNLLRVNPTILHTHGLIVEPHMATPDNRVFGDNIFVSIFNPANRGAIIVPLPNKLPTDGHGSVMAAIYADYAIQNPNNHPLGSFFFHPHVHGLALNQMSMGMSGIITIGRASDYAKGNKDNAPFSDANVRHLVLKDMQVLDSNVGLSQQSPDFCAADQPAERGSCAGAGEFDGGRWHFTVNGQSYPRIDVTSPEGEIWRITNSSGNVTYNLQLDDGAGKVLLTQLLSVDGVTINLPADAPPETIVTLSAGRFKVRPCPGAAVDQNTRPACVSEMTLMPSARAEIWVSYRNGNGAITTGQNREFILRQKQVQMGTGDTWPAVDLASVTFNQVGKPSHADRQLKVMGEALAGFKSTGVFRKKVPYATASALTSGCAALPPGHRRRIFFGVDQSDGSFGLGYEQIDENGDVVSAIDVKKFDPANPFVCLPLDKGQKPANETWELVNLATENHNFHIHQTKFYQLTETTSTPDVKGAGVMQDNLPLPVATPEIDVESQGGACTMGQWHSGQCQSNPVLVGIPFAQVGEFVYHCHILEHEDGGMMARIKVVASPR